MAQYWRTSLESYKRKFTEREYLGFQHNEIIMVEENKKVDKLE